MDPYEQADQQYAHIIKGLRAKWGKAWPKLDGNIRRWMIASAVIDSIARQKADPSAELCDALILLAQHALHAQ